MAERMLAGAVLPPFVLGVFDQFVGARMLDRYPELYTLGQNNAFVGLSLSGIFSGRQSDARRGSSRSGSSGNGWPMPYTIPWSAPFDMRDLAARH